MNEHSQARLPKNLALHPGRTAGGLGMEHALSGLEEMIAGIGDALSSFGEHFSLSARPAQAAGVSPECFARQGYGAVFLL